MVVFMLLILSTCIESCQHGTCSALIEPSQNGSMFPFPCSCRAYSECSARRNWPSRTCGHYTFIHRGIAWVELYIFVLWNLTSFGGIDNRSNGLSLRQNYRKSSSLFSIMPRTSLWLTSIDNGFIFLNTKCHILRGYSLYWFWLFFFFLYDILQQVRLHTQKSEQESVDTSLLRTDRFTSSDVQPKNLNLQVFWVYISGCQIKSDVSSSRATHFTF